MTNYYLPFYSNQLANQRNIYPSYNTPVVEKNTSMNFPYLNPRYIQFQIDYFSPFSNLK